MGENPKMRPLQKKDWDLYRDLNKVIGSELCCSYRIGLSKICVIDNENEKLQSCLQNAILSDGYSAEDILGQPNKRTDMVRDEAWQQAYLGRLADLVLDMLENAEDIPEYLAQSGRVPEDHRPEDLLPIL